MGKQAKRKNKRRSGDKHHRPTGRPTGLADDPLLDDSPAVAAAPSSSTTGAIVARIRHGDPRVRHACLVALSRTLYDGSALERKNASSAVESLKRKSGYGGASLTTSGTKKAEPNDPILLRALSERILDVDVPCATIAVGCLSNYVNFHRHDDDDDIDDDDDDDGDFFANVKNEEDVTLSTVLVPILVHRIRDTSAAMHSMALIANEEDNNNNNNKKIKSLKSKGGESSSRSKEDEKRQLVLRELWILQSLSLSTLAGLIENRPRSILQRTGVHHGDNNNNNDEVGGNTNVPLVGELISVLELTKDATTALTTADMKPIVESAINASRALHSLFDDNASLIDSLLRSTSTTAAANNTMASSSSSSLSPPTLDDILSKLSNIITNEHSPTAARVHACGSLLALRKIIVMGQHTSSSSSIRQQPHNQQNEYHLVLQLQSCVNELVIPHLSSFFDEMTNNKAMMNTTTTIHNVLGRMITLSNQLSSMKDDEDMEMQIVSTVNARGESAMSIAKRQKGMKSSSSTKKLAPLVKMEDEDGVVTTKGGVDVTNGEEQQDEAAAAMVVEDGDEEVMGHEQRKREQAEDEIKEELDGIVSTWKDIVGTQKLALELVANLYANSNDDEDDNHDRGDDDEDDDGGMMYGGEDDDNDEQMWDSDDEAKLLSTANDAKSNHSSNNNDSAIALFERETYESMMNLSPKIIPFFHRWVNFTSDFVANKTMMMSATNSSFPIEDSNDGSIVSNVETENAASTLIDLPALVSRDIDEVLSTCALCLGNVVTCNQIKEEEKKESDFNKLLWLELVAMLLDDDHNHHRHVTSVMQSVLLRHPPQSRFALIDTTTLDRLISLLLSNDGRDNKIEDSNVILELQLCIISMFGTLCTSNHPETVDTKVCRALLSRLTLAISNDNSTRTHQPQHMITTRYSILITHEILNVLMDVYGSDDCYEVVFRNECVLDHIHKCLPWFKKTAKSVAASSSGSKSNRMEEEGFVWNETALNAMRFIKYKQSTK